MGTSAKEVPASSEDEESTAPSATRECGSEQATPAGRDGSGGPRGLEARCAGAGEREGLPCTGADAVGCWPTTARKRAPSWGVPVQPGAPTPSSRAEGLEGWVVKCGRGGSTPDSGRDEKDSSVRPSTACTVWIWSCSCSCSPMSDSSSESGASGSSPPASLGRH